MVSLQVIFSPFQSPVAFAMSSPTFLGDCKGGTNQRRTSIKVTHQTKRADFRRKRRRSADLAADAAQVHNLDLIRIELRRHDDSVRLDGITLSICARAYRSEKMKDVTRRMIKKRQGQKSSIEITP